MHFEVYDVGSGTVSIVLPLLVLVPEKNGNTVEIVAC
jgi:hypothetical protein